MNQFPVPVTVDTFSSLRQPSVSPRPLSSLSTTSSVPNPAPSNQFTGEKLAKCLALFPTLYLSAGTCSALIIVGGGSMKLFFDIVCGATCTSKPLTAIEWYLVFTCLAVILAQLPNLNSIAGVSLVGAVTAIVYCTMIWVMSVSKGKLPGVSYHTAKARSDVDSVLGILSSLGIIAFAFKGHNLVLEIQVNICPSL